MVTLRLHYGYLEVVFFLIKSVTICNDPCYVSFVFFCRNPTPPFSFLLITTNLTTQSVAFQALAVPGETVRETPLMLRYKCN